MSATSPYYVLDSEEEETGALDSDVELLDYDSDSSQPTVLSIDSDRFQDRSSRSYTSSSHTSKARGKPEPRSNGSITLPDVEIQKYRLDNGVLIEPGDTVELKDFSKQSLDGLYSGDFLRVKHVITNLTTDEVRLRGYLLRRTKYLRQIFDWKRNELAMVLRVDEDDNRSPLIAGMEEFPVDQILRKRDCVFTNKRFPFQSFRNESNRFPRSMSKQDAVRQIFHGGRLCCRVAYIRFISRTGKDVSGVVRHLHTEEIDRTGSKSPLVGPGLSREHSLIIEDDEEEDAVIVTEGFRSRGKCRARSPSVEVLELPKRRSSLPVKSDRYTFADVFCGAGGASQGALQAGLHVCWGLDNDEEALNAYYLNHPGTLPFCRNAHHFPPPGFKNSDLRVDVLHLSPPCCYWSPAHTHDGQNDQANYEAIYTVGPILKAVKPRIATLEQTFGLMTHEQHQCNFRMLLYDIGKAGYDLRYKLQDMSKLGLVQKRKRLLIIAARRGTPLPPFPEDTHGAEGSRLEPFVFIDNALKVMDRLGPRALNDVYHQPKPMASPKTPYDPHNFLKGCITTGGGDNYHYAGKRRYTAREMSLFQSFPYHYQFSGRPTQAMKQVGNAFPPVIAEAMYKTIIMALAAYDDGLISAEDDLTNLDGVFAQLRLNSTTTLPTPQGLSVIFSEAATEPNLPSMTSLNDLYDGSRNMPGSFKDASEGEDNDDDDDEVVFLGSSRRTT